MALTGKLVFEGPRPPDVTCLAARYLQEQIAAVGDIDAIPISRRLRVSDLSRHESADDSRCHDSLRRNRTLPMRTRVSKLKIGEGIRAGKDGDLRNRLENGRKLDGGEWLRMLHGGPRLHHRNYRESRDTREAWEGRSPSPLARRNNRNKALQ
jgi:hypothetical protein